LLRLLAATEAAEAVAVEAPEAAALFAVFLVPLLNLRASFRGGAMMNWLAQRSTPARLPYSDAGRRE
jgi:hypothetical protein